MTPLHACILLAFASLSVAQSFTRGRRFVKTGHTGPISRISSHIARVRLSDTRGIDPTCASGWTDRGQKAHVFSTGLVYVAAEDYAAGVACGQRIKINTLRNEEIVVVAGQCLDCLPGDIEVSTDVFYVFEDSENIAFNANWNFIATDVSQQEITQPVKSIQTDSPTRVQAISSFLRSRPHHSPRALLSSRRNDIASVPNSHSTIQAGSVATPVLTSIPDKRDDNTSFTWYAVGLGACGHRNKPSDYVVALNAVEFGSGQQCGRKIEIHAEGKTAVAYIVDKCPGCVRGGLDLSQSLFEHFAPTKKGVLHGSWRFI